MSLAFLRLSEAGDKDAASGWTRTARIVYKGEGMRRLAAADRGPARILLRP